MKDNKKFQNAGNSKGFEIFSREKRVCNNTWDALLLT